MPEFKQNLIDIELMKKAREGDTSAFDILVIKYQCRISKLVSIYIRDPSEVLDVVQDTFIRAFKALHTFRFESTFYTWLHRIAVNAAKNNIAIKIRKIPYDDIDIYEVEKTLTKIMHTDLVTTENLMINFEANDVICNVINSLPQELKNAIMLREVEERTYDEISNITGCPIGTVRSRINRAKQVIEKKSQPFV